MMSAPLLIGLDLRRMDETAKTILTNKYLISIDQDSLCMQGRVVRREESKFDIWVKPLSGVRWAVGLLNRTSEAETLSFSAEDMGLTNNIKGNLLDVWTGEVLRFDGGFSAETHGHEMKVYIFEPIF